MTTAPAAPFGNDFPHIGRGDASAVAVKAPGPIEDAFAHAGDRLDRLEHVLGELNGVVMRAGHQLEPVLTAGTYADLEEPRDPGNPTPEDRRSTIARRLSGNAERTDRLADAAVAIRIRLEAILDALEV